MNNSAIRVGLAATLALGCGAHTSATADEVIDRPTPPPLTFGEGGFGLTRTPATAPSIVAADFNNDGLVDLAWISDPNPSGGPDQGDTVTIVLGFGDGRFAEHLVLDLPGTELLAEDFNGDGLIDLAVAGPTLVLRYNQGDALFDPPFDTGIPATDRSEPGLALTAADVDQDGDPDIIISDAQGRLDTAINNTTSFLLVTGTRSSFATDRPRLLDLNQDAFPDLVYLRRPDTLVFRLGLGDGAFAPSMAEIDRVVAFTVQSTPGPTFITTAAPFSQKVSIFQTNQVTGLDPVPLLVLEAEDEGFRPAMVDLDADGELDLIVGQTTFFSPLQTSGLGRTTTSPVTLSGHTSGSGYEPNLGPKFLLIDVNNDSAPDRVEPGYVRLSTRGQNNLPRHGHRNVGPTLDVHSHVAAADLDQDGLTDIVASGFNQLELRFGRPAGPAGTDDTLGPPVSLSHGLTDFSGFITLLLDINGDTLPDIVALDRDPRVLAMTNLGNRAFSPAQSLVLSTGNSEIAGIATADLDNDGDPDFVVSNDADNQLVTILNNNGVLSIGQRLALPQGRYTTLTLLDINGDTFPDAIVGEADSNQILFATGNPDATFTLVGPVFLPASPYWLTATDANSDGIDDLLVTTRDPSGADSPIIFWTRSPQHNIEFIPTVVPTSFPALEAVAIDLNGDGHNDLLTAQTDTDSGSIIVYNGVPETVGWPELTRFSTTLAQIQNPFPSGVIAADLNQDSLPDLLWSSNSTQLDIALQNQIPMGTCRTDIQGDNVSDSADISAFIELFLDNHPAADLNHDTIIDIADIQRFVDLFIAGC